jgi:dTDP-4-amino-4,6-dideoxygalactose transaminase
MNTVRTQIGIGSCRISPLAKKLVLEALDNNRVSAGPMMERFERSIARLHGCRFGLMCNSGTSALHIALAAVREREGWKDGDEVLVPAVTFVATSNVVLFNNLTPVFVDVEPQYYCIDPRDIERHLTPRTRAIMPVHVAGQPCDMDPILDIAAKRRLAIVEDSAEAMFVRYKGRPVGSFSVIGCFSTYVAHLISTGVGGLCVTNDADYDVTLRSLMNHGRDSIYTRIDDDQGLEGAKLFEVASRRFSFERLGFSFRATEMEAALGLAELEERDANHARRLSIVARFDAALARYDRYLQRPAARPDAEHARMFYPLVVRDAKISRDRLVRHLEDRSIETRYLLPLINQPLYRRLFGNMDDRYPVAARLNRDAFYIGCHPEMSDEDVEYVIASFDEFFRSV